MHVRFSNEEASNACTRSRNPVPPCLAPPGAGRRAEHSGGAEGQIEFNTPSGNIGCIYTPKGGTSTYEPQDGGPELSCSRVAPSYVTIILGPKGPATLIKNPGEQSCCSDVTKLAYGKSWSAGPFSCESSTKGLTCTATDFSSARPR